MSLDTARYCMVVIEWFPTWGHQSIKGHVSCKTERFVFIFLGKNFFCKLLNVAWFCISRPLITILIKQPETLEFLLGWAADSLYASLPAIAMARSLFFSGWVSKPQLQTQTEAQRLELENDWRFIAKFKGMNMSQAWETGAGAEQTELLEKRKSWSASIYKLQVSECRLTEQVTAVRRCACGSAESLSWLKNEMQVVRLRP